MDNFIHILKPLEHLISIHKYFTAEIKREIHPLTFCVQCGILLRAKNCSFQNPKLLGSFPKGTHFFSENVPLLYCSEERINVAFSFLLRLAYINTMFYHRQ